MWILWALCMENQSQDSKIPYKRTHRRWKEGCLQHFHPTSYLGDDDFILVCSQVAQMCSINSQRWKTMRRNKDKKSLLHPKFQQCNHWSDRLCCLISRAEYLFMEILTFCLTLKCEKILKPSTTKIYSWKNIYFVLALSCRNKCCLN